MRFRLVPNSSTLDDLERRKRPSFRNRKVLRRPPENLNEGRHKLSAAKCRSMVLLSKNIKYIRGDSCGHLKDRPSKEISDETVGISLIFCFLAYDVTSTPEYAAQSATPTVLEKQGCEVV